MKLRTNILLGIVALVVAIIAATVVAVVVVVDRSERTKQRADLVRSRGVFEDLLGYRDSTLRSDCGVVANEPRVRATVGTRGVNHATMVDLVAELKSSLHHDMFLLLDPQGVLLVDAFDPAAEGFDLGTQPGVAQARTKGDGSSLWVVKQRVYQIQACRIQLGEETLGVVVVGRVLDDNVARVIERQTGSALVIAVDGERIAGSSATPETREEITGGLQVVGRAGAEVMIGGEAVVVTGGPMPNYDGKRRVEFLLWRSVDAALAPVRRLTYGILAIAAIALAASLLLAFVLSRRLTRPLDKLVQFTGTVAGGALGARAQPTGTREVRALAVAMNQMMEDLERSRAQLAVNERLGREMEIAMRIQTSILPPAFDVPGLEIAGCMLPATEVGGDYYDVIPIQGGCWIGIGDVAGHGLTAGLEMLMVQSVVAALVRERPNAPPRELVRVLNEVIYDNVRNRLHQDEHVTLTLVRYVDGKLTFAGAHEDIVVLGRDQPICSRVPTPGTWVGAIRDVSRPTVDSNLALSEGDLVVLYTDGVTEARDATGAVFGMERLCAAIEAARAEPVEKIRDRIVAAVQAWQAVHEDDISVLVIRRARTA